MSTCRDGRFPNLDQDTRDRHDPPDPELSKPSQPINNEAPMGPLHPPLEEFCLRISRNSSESDKVFRRLAELGVTPPATPDAEHAVTTVLGGPTKQESDA